MALPFAQTVSVKLKNGKEKKKKKKIWQSFYDCSNKQFIRGDDDMRCLHGQVSSRTLFYAH